MNHAKIKRFLADEEMAQSVKALLLQSFLKPRPQTDVHLLAASRLSVDFLEDAWREMARMKDADLSDGAKGNVGV